MTAVFIGLSLVLMTVAAPVSSDAQVLKNLVNNMKQPDASKASCQPGQPSPHAKPSISPGDSAAAIKSFMTGTGGSGILYQYRVTYHFMVKKKDSAFVDTTSLAITDGHNMRSDIGSFGSKMEVLGHAGLPRYSVRLFPEKKTYSFNIIDTAAMNSGDRMIYQVTKVGNESVSGYNCIHSRMTIAAAGDKSGGTTEDVWTSTDVPGYSTLKNMAAIQGATPKMMRALDQAGCGGMFVKVTTVSTIFSMDMGLITAARKSFPDALFQIPAGYTQVNR